MDALVGVLELDGAAVEQAVGLDVTDDQLSVGQEGHAAVAHCGVPQEQVQLHAGTKANKGVCARTADSELWEGGGRGDMKHRRKTKERDRLPKLAAGVGLHSAAVPPVFGLRLLMAAKVLLGKSGRRPAVQTMRRIRLHNDEEE